MFHPVEDETQDSTSQEDGQEGSQEPAQVVPVAPHSQLVSQAGVQRYLALGD